MASSKEPVISAASLESKLAANPKSPFFARLAASYMKDGRTKEALDLCLEGVKAYPHYATGHLVLARCYEALGRNIEAMLEYRMVLKVVPDNAPVQSQMKLVEQREQDAFKSFAEERTRQLKDRRDEMQVENYVSEDAPRKEATVDVLMNRLQDVKSITPASGQPSEESPPPSEPAGKPKIVTETLAEIYASQGEYGEAIEAFRRLMTERPLESERYEKRIVQLEELARLQQGQGNG